MAEPTIAEPTAPEEDPDVISHNIVRRLMMPMVIAVLAYGALLLYADAGAIAGHALDVPVLTIVMAVSLSLGNYFIRYLRWQYYLRRLDLSVPSFDSLLIFIAGFSMSITPGKVGEVVKSLLLKHRYGIPIARSAPIVLAERITDLSALLVLGGIGLLSVPGGLWSAVISLAFVGVLFALCASRSLGNFAINVATKLPFLSRRRAKLVAVQESILELNRPGSFSIGLAFSFVAWGLQCFSLNVIAWSFPNVTLSVQHGLLAYAAPLLAGTLALIPGGLGVTEGSMTGALQTLGGPAMTPAVAAAITILCRFTTFWLAIGLGFLALGLWRSRHRHD